jgi:hypothetical protein
MTDRLEDVVEGTQKFLNLRTPEVTEAVMRRVATAPPPRRERPGAWARTIGALWTARTVSFRFRPAYGLALAASLTAAVLAFRAPAPAATSPSPTQRLFVQFRLATPNATNVRLAGSFTGWQRQYELHQVAPDVWAITLPLSPGVYDYAFLIDGHRWVADPLASSVDDGFGGTNSRIALLAPEDLES